MRHVKAQRMQTASFYLKNSNMRIQEIARNLGYSHVSQFSRDFHQYSGLSPLAYRRKIGED